MVIKENIAIFTPEEINEIPETFGVYIMKDSSGNIIYVGKARNLKKRVSSYFQKRQDIKTASLVENIAFIDIISVTNESEALILEANLIKQYKPKYNIQFKDNKFYPFIKITNDKFPRIVFAREEKRDGSLYFGPYISAKLVRDSIDIIQKTFQLRVCKTLPKKECLYYHINMCSAPCIKKISEEDYRKNVKRAIEFLNGEYKKLISQLTEEMKEKAKELKFEEAQKIKEKIEAITVFEDSQNVFLNKEISRDYIGIFSKWGKSVIVVSRVRNGKMVGKQSYSGTVYFEENEDDILRHFLLEYRNDNIDVVVDGKFKELVAELNKGIKEKKFFTSDDSVENSIVKISTENAALHFSQLWTKVDASENLDKLKEVLGLKNIPIRIEGFDIANILGEFAVASVVSFYNGKPDKKNYRHMKIRSKNSPDDFAMIYEAVYRRYDRLKRENKDFPDLILIDGGKGQLNAALKALNELELKVDVVSLAKENEEIFLPFKSEPIRLPKNSPALHILQQVRDETHRFANSFYNKIKNKSELRSIFDEIKGIGKKRREIIMQKFLNYDIIKNLKKEDLIKASLPENVATEVYEKLKKFFEKDS
ncbi:MAG: excinuclease ABC subunit UvrC [Brevinematales bacterium]|nr:excinuclease ABC subunit UvrC [Brevinematales bacterium]